MAEIVKKSSLYSSESLNDKAVIESEVFEASRKAREILNEAQQKAEEIIYRSNSEAHRKYEEAKKKGFSEGKEQGLQTFEKAILKVNQDYDELLKQAEEQLLHLSLSVAKKIIGSEIKVNPSVVIEMIRKALKPMNRKRSISLIIHPLDRRILEQNKKNLMQSLLEGGTISFIEDPNITRGGCIVQTEEGSVDARLETQLRFLNQFLTGNDEEIEMFQDDLPFSESEEPSLEAIEEEKQMNENREEFDFVEETVPDYSESIESQDFKKSTVESPKENQSNLSVEAQEGFLNDIDQLTKEIQEGGNLEDLLNNLDEYLQESEQNKKNSKQG